MSKKFKMRELGTSWHCFVARCTIINDQASTYDNNIYRTLLSISSQLKRKSLVLGTDTSYLILNIYYFTKILFSPYLQSHVCIKSS